MDLGSISSTFYDRLVVMVCTLFSVVLSNITFLLQVDQAVGGSRTPGWQIGCLERRHSWGWALGCL